MVTNKHSIDSGPTRVLLLSTGAGIGGEESSTTDLGESLMKRGLDVRVATTGETHIEELQRRGIRVERLPIGNRKPMGLLRGTRALAKYATEQQIDILHAQSAGPAIMCILAKALGMFSKPRPRIIWHDRGITQYWLLSKLFNGLDMTIANGDSERNKLISHGLRPEKVVRVHNGIDTSKLCVSDEERAKRRRTARQEFGWSDDVPVAGFVGRLSVEKAPDVLVRSFATVRQLVPETRFLVIGDGPMRQEIERLRRELGAEDRIVMTGFRRDVPVLLCGMDVLALVSNIETFGRATIEAMAMHLPCVATNVGGIPEQITDGENGHIVPPNDPESLGRAIADLLADPAKRKAMGEAGFHRVTEYFNLDRMVDEITEVYRQLLV